MSDIVDRSNCVADILGRGGRFDKKVYNAMGNRNCACGRGPVYRLAAAGGETLGCAAGCRRVGPSCSRQKLKQMWNFNEGGRP